ncbi:MAG: carbohydrate ABC transporter permease [Kiritimatiellaeota bacterium]|nr:carbohydrate ABC transporter permease [Kiritimatiellota bacterium]
MAIISEIGRKAPKVRLLIWSIYTVLTLGALSMIYPFLLMISGSMKSSVDLKDFDAVPKFLYSDTDLYRNHISRYLQGLSRLFHVSAFRPADPNVLYRKYIEGLFNESLDVVRETYDIEFRSFETVDPPATINRDRVRLWHEFLKDIRPSQLASACGFVSTPASRTEPEMLRRFKRRIMKKTEGDVDVANREYQTQFVNWNAFYVLPEDYLLRRNKPNPTPFMREFWQFKSEQPEVDIYYFSVKGFYKRVFLKAQYTKEIEAYNKAHHTTFESWDEVVLPRRYPAEAPGPVRDDWEHFVRNTLNLLWVRAKPEAAPLYRAFLKAKYGDIGAFKRNYGPKFNALRSFDEVPLVRDPPLTGVVLSDWEAFLTGWKDPDTGRMHMLPASMVYIQCLDFQFQDWLMKRFGSLARVNAALGTNYAVPEQIAMPQREAHYAAFQANKGRLRREFVVRNYATVLDYLVFHGRGIMNTVIYCSLAVLCALLVNPLAAYAMSRYKMPSTYKILLFLMLTMAFPPMVTQIPVFLMLRNFHLLNTFAALILPGLANGYSIFLLKGFFDSLPRELYESAALDGAGEWTMFWQITMSLSKPILAVIGLSAFTLAYSNFMFALLICQDEKMWTMMVWLYQLQMRSGQAVVYASLIIAGIPTLLIFVFAQNIIMRGIVVPVEK